MMTMVPPHKAYQHLTERLRLDNPALTVTLCGLDYDDVYEPVIYHHRTGYDPSDGPACERCADAADKLQNG